MIIFFGGLQTEAVKLPPSSLFLLSIFFGLFHHTRKELETREEGSRWNFKQIWVGPKPVL